MALDISRYVRRSGASGPSIVFNEQKASFKEWAKASGVDVEMCVIDKVF